MQQAIFSRQKQYINRIKVKSIEIHTILKTNLLRKEMHVQTKKVTDQPASGGAILSETVHVCLLS